MAFSRVGRVALIAALGLAVAVAAAAQTTDSFTDLHEALRLTPAQEPGWRAFVAASQTSPEQTARQRAAQTMLPRLTAPQRVDLSVAAMRADLRTLEARGEALKTFYATLTPEQQHTFDLQTAPRSQAPPAQGYDGEP
jgi:hypothetical protein